MDDRPAAKKLWAQNSVFAHLFRTSFLVVVLVKLESHGATTVCHPMAIQACPVPHTRPKERYLGE